MRLDPGALSLIVVILAIAVIALAVWAGMLQRTLTATRRRLRAAFSGAGDAGLDEVLERILKRLDGTDERLGALNSLHQELEALLRKGTIRNVGVVRFNPFADAGGDQSFAIALLDSEGSGIVLSSLHARTDTRVFAKPVQTGRSRYPLSDEEQDAIRRALTPGERAVG
ncbi:MAG: DUF4446 family protein [Chloroflexota bacterium]|nr:DUF4446 family protein [Chloroflexota bacterium]MDE3193279.1 DUF4446 family protein [Chloroflexota bacterium]